MIAAYLVFLVSAQQGATPLTIEAPTSVDVASTVWAPEIRFHAVRPEKLEGAAAWRVISSPAGIRATLIPTENDSAKVYVRGFCDGPQGDVELVIEGGIADRKGQAKVTLKRGSAKLLLVDDDRSDNNLATPSSRLSASDELYRRLLLEGDGKSSLIYDSVTVERYSNGPSLDTMAKYDAILWYTAAEYGGQKDNAIVLSDKDTDNLMAWMAKGKMLAVFSPGYISNIQGFVKVAKSNEEQWTKVEDAFLSETLGLNGGRGLIHRFNEVDVQTEDSQKFHLAGRKPVEAQISPVNPAKAKALMFANLNPDNKGPRLVPCAVANVTDKGSALYVGFSFENIVENVGAAFRVLVSPVFGWGSPPG